jgi:hypothetical protein
MILNFVFFVPSWWRLFSAFYPQEARKSLIGRTTTDNMIDGVVLGCPE